MYWYYILLLFSGFLGGFLAGLIGIGGGLIYILVIPDVLRLLGVPTAEIPQYTIANSLFTIFITSLIVNYKHFKSKIYYKELILIGVSSSIFSVLSLKYVVNTHVYSIFTFNLITLILIVLLFINALYRVNKSNNISTENPNTLMLIITGIAGGVISSFSGLGGGIVVIPLLGTLMNYNIKKASIISSGVIMITSLFSTIFNMTELPKHSISSLSFGYIIVPLVASLLLGVALTSSLGVKTATKLSPKKISVIYLLLLVFIFIKKLIDIFNIN